MGGFVETSGEKTLDVAGAHVDTRAADGSAGTWLLDPADITIAHSTTAGSANFAPTSAASVINDVDINGALTTTNVTITTSSGSGGSGNGSAFLLAGSCTNCHTQVHGSNHPAGAKLMR